MARLPSGRYLIQQVGEQVILFEEHTEHEIVKFDPAKMGDVALAQTLIAASELTADDKAWAHFWSGYFYAHAAVDGGTAPAGPVREEPRAPGPHYADLGFTDDQIARGEDFGRYDFPNLGSPGPDRDNIREW
jgi:hypothetical protein